MIIALVFMEVCLAVSLSVSPADAIREVSACSPPCALAAVVTMGDITLVHYRVYVPWIRATTTAPTEMRLSSHSLGRSRSKRQFSPGPLSFRMADHRYRSILSGHKICAA